MTGGDNFLRGSAPYGKGWAVIAVDWVTKNVIEWCEREEDAKRVADAYDRLAVRATAVPFGDPMIRE
jgi:hypothetical protein